MLNFTENIVGINIFVNIFNFYKTKLFYNYKFAFIDIYKTTMLFMSLEDIFQNITRFLTAGWILWKGWWGGGAPKGLTHSIITLGPFM